MMCHARHLHRHASRDQPGDGTVRPQSPAHIPRRGPIRDATAEPRATSHRSNKFVTQDVLVRYAAKPVTYGATLKFNFR
jgi:hypothetical protein